MQKILLRHFEALKNVDCSNNMDLTHILLYYYFYQAFFTVKTLKTKQRKKRKNNVSIKKYKQKN